MKVKIYFSFYYVFIFQIYNYLIFYLLKQIKWRIKLLEAQK